MIKKHFNLRINSTKHTGKNYNQFTKGESVLLLKGNMTLRGFAGKSSARV